MIQHNVMTPRPYSRMYQVVGADGYASKYPIEEYCLRNGLPLDMDVYDLAEWCCMAELTRLSIENNSAPVEVPDFTRGGWSKVNGYRHAFAK